MPVDLGVISDHPDGAFIAPTATQRLRDAAFGPLDPIESAAGCWGRSSDGGFIETLTLDFNGQRARVASLIPGFPVIHIQELELERIGDNRVRLTMARFIGWYPIEGYARFDSVERPVFEWLLSLDGDLLAATRIVSPVMNPDELDADLFESRIFRRFECVIDDVFGSPLD